MGKPHRFRLEISPKKLVVPLTKPLEVAIKNPTKRKFKVKIKLYSHYYELKSKETDVHISETFHFDSCRSTHFERSLGPGATVNLIIGVPKKMDPEHIIKYNEKIKFLRCETPEGFLEIEHSILFKEEEDMFEDQEYNYPKSVENTKEEVKLYSDGETEQMEQIKKEFMKIKIEIDRKFRWRIHPPDSSLPNHIWELDLDENIEKKTDALAIALEGYPNNLEEIDKMTDEEVKEMKTKWKDQLIEDYEKDLKQYEAEKAVAEEKEEEEAKRRFENRKNNREEDKKLPVEVVDLGDEEQMTLYEVPRNFLKRLRKETPPKSFQTALENAKVRKAQIVCDPAEKIKVTPKKEASEVKESKPVDEPKKSVIQKTSEVKKPASTVSDVKKTKVDEVKPNEQGKKVIEDPKKSKKNKKNPCCVVM